MSQIISDRLNRLSESQTIAMARRSRELKAQGVDVISLSLGEPDFNTPEFIKDAAKKALDEISPLIRLFLAIKSCARPYATS